MTTANVIPLFLRLHPVRTPNAAAEIGFAATQVARLARRLDVDILHANSIRASIVVGLAARLSRRPAVGHLRDRLPPGAASNASLRLIGATCEHVIGTTSFPIRGSGRYFVIWITDLGSNSAVHVNEVRAAS